MNIKSVKTLDYFSIMLMLKFEFKQYHFDINSIIFSNSANAEQSLSIHQYQIYIALKKKNKLLINETVNYIHDYQRKKQRQQKILNFDDLVLVRNHQVDKNHKKKLKSK